MNFIKTHILTLIVILLNINSLSAQGFKAPEEGKAVVYFVRVSGYGGAASFEYFHQDKYIGVFKGQNYLRYECDPGKQLLWASSENKEFITSELTAGESYIVIVDIVIGAWKPRVGLDPIHVNEEELFERAIELINSKAPIVTSDEKIKKMNKKLAKFIPEKLKMYEEEWKHEHNFKHIAPDMAIPKSMMQ